MYFQQVRNKAFLSVGVSDQEFALYPSALFGTNSLIQAAHASPVLLTVSAPSPPIFTGVILPEQRSLASEPCFQDTHPGKRGERPWARHPAAEDTRQRCPITTRRAV